MNRKAESYFAVPLFLPVVEAQTKEGFWVRFLPQERPVLVRPKDWVGFDLDGTLSRTDNPGHYEPPYPIGDPIPEMIDLACGLIRAGLKVRIFTARACDPLHVPAVQSWAEKHGLGGLEVTNQKDFDLVRFYDDRAIQIHSPGALGRYVMPQVLGSETAQNFPSNPPNNSK